MQRKTTANLIFLSILFLIIPPVWAESNAVSVDISPQSLTTSVGKNFSFDVDDATKLWGLSPIGIAVNNGQGPFPLGWQPQPLNAQVAPPGGIPASVPVGTVSGSGQFPAGGIPATPPLGQPLPGLQVPGPIFGVVTPFGPRIPPLVVPGQTVGSVTFSQKDAQGVSGGSGPFPLGLRDPIAIVQIANQSGPFPLGIGGGSAPISAGVGSRERRPIIVASSGNTVFVDGSVAPGIEPIIATVASADNDTEEGIVRVSDVGNAVFVGQQGLPPLQLPTAVFGVVSPVTNGVVSAGVRGAGIPSLQQGNDPRSGIVAMPPSDTHDVIKVEFSPRPSLPPFLSPEKNPLLDFIAEAKPKIMYIPPGGPFPLDYRGDEKSADSELYPIIPPDDHIAVSHNDRNGESRDTQTAGLRGVVWSDHEKTYQAEIGEISVGVITAAPHVFFEDRVGKDLPSTDEGEKKRSEIQWQIDDTGHVQKKSE